MFRIWVRDVAVGYRNKESSSEKTQGRIHKPDPDKKQITKTGTGQVRSARSGGGGGGGQVKSGHRSGHRSGHKSGHRSGQVIRQVISQVIGQVTGQVTS